MFYQNSSRKILRTKDIVDLEPLHRLMCGLCVSMVWRKKRKKDDIRMFGVELVIYMTVVVSTFCLNDLRFVRLADIGTSAQFIR